MRLLLKYVKLILHILQKSLEKIKNVWYNYIRIYYRNHRKEVCQ